MKRKISQKNIRQASKIFSSGTKATIIAFIGGLFIGLGVEELGGIGEWYSKDIKTDKINICFTPPSGCGFLIAREINNAIESIYVQSFDFTSPLIAKALIKAHKRNITVKILTDRTTKNNQYSMIPLFEEAGIEVVIDKVSGLAHNKIMIIDKKKVITGSFNFTKGADNRNSENVLLIEDELVAQRYMKNWINRRYNQ